MQTLDKAYNDRINEIHNNYISIIAPLIMQIEVLDGKFPVEILNEIRAVFAHLSKSHLADDNAVVERNLSKADSHIKRAIIDCYKYLCFAYDNKYEEFDTIYANVDLSDKAKGKYSGFKGKKRVLDRHMYRYCRIISWYCGGCDCISIVCYKTKPASMCRFCFSKI
jgi:hypothetical protein